MKSKKMLESMNLIDDRFIEDAMPEALKPKRHRWIAAVAAVGVTEPHLAKEIIKTLTGETDS